MNFDEVVKKYPEAKIVSSKMAFIMMKNYFGTDFAEKPHKACHKHGCP